MNKLVAAVAALGVLAAAPAFANADLAKAKGCMGCHAVDKKMVGPAYKDVAAKYKAADEAKLVKKVMEGGAGAWGAVPMPKNNVTEAEAKQLVKWVLSQK